MVFVSDCAGNLNIDAGVYGQIQTPVTWHSDNMPTDHWVLQPRSATARIRYHNISVFSLRSHGDAAVMLWS